MCQPIPKQKRTRLKGNKVAQLNKEIHDRDGYACIVCGRFVDLVEKWHHERCGAYKEDRIEYGCLLCQQCHYERHHGKRSAEIRRRCEAYLSGLYPDVWEV